MRCHPGTKPIANCIRGLPRMGIETRIPAAPPCCRVIASGACPGWGLKRGPRPVPDCAPDCIRGLPRMGIETSKRCGQPRRPNCIRGLPRMGIETTRLLPGMPRYRHCIRGLPRMGIETGAGRKKCTRPAIASGACPGWGLKHDLPARARLRPHCIRGLPRMGIETRLRQRSPREVVIASGACPGWGLKLLGLWSRADDHIASGACPGWGLKLANSFHRTETTVLHPGLAPDGD